MRNLDEILKLHRQWLRDPTKGQRAILRRADVPGADLRGADLRKAHLDGANLRGTLLQTVNFSGANFGMANLEGANLERANLENAFFAKANLEGANLKGTNLQGANLRWARVHNVQWPAPSMVLLASWGELSDRPTALGMALDRDNHPNPERFQEWANGGGPCPYDFYHVERVFNFQENRELYDHTLPAPSMYSLMQMVLEERCQTTEQPPWNTQNAAKKQNNDSTRDSSQDKG